MATKHVAVEIEGTTPLLMNKFTDAAQRKASSSVSAVTVGDKGTPREIAEVKIYLDAEGYPCVPGPNVFACLIAAGKFHKVGKSKVTTQKSSLVPAGVVLPDLNCPVTNNGEKRAKTTWEVDSRPVVIPSTGGRIICHRPRFDAWRTRFSLEIDDEMFDPKFVRTLLDDAGKKIGLGDFRPDRRGPFGRFVVIRWEAESARAAA